MSSSESTWIIALSAASLSFFFFSSRRRHTRCSRDWSSDVCSSDLIQANVILNSGAAMDYVAGEIPTPPRWSGQIGAEWLFRLASDPCRLWRRYLLEDRKSTRLNSSHGYISYAVFCLKKKTTTAARTGSSRGSALWAAGRSRHPALFAHLTQLPERPPDALSRADAWVRLDQACHRIGE